MALIDETKMFDNKIKVNQTQRISENFRMII